MSIIARFIGIIALVIFSNFANSNCLPKQDEIREAIQGQSEFIHYICPTSPEECQGNSLLDRIEIRSIDLKRKNSKKISPLACVVTPINKGKQFPTLVYQMLDATPSLMVSDWEAGLKFLESPQKNGWKIIEGQSQPEPGRIEIYRLRRANGNYQEYQRTCFEQIENGNKLQKTPCRKQLNNLK